MNYSYFKSLVPVLLYSTFSLHAMQRNKPITIVVAKNRSETITFLQKEKSTNKYLLLMHTHDSKTKEQSWTAYLQLIVSNRYRAYYKFNQEEARTKWEKLTQDQNS